MLGQEVGWECEIGTRVDMSRDVIKGRVMWYSPQYRPQILHNTSLLLGYYWVIA